MEDRREPDFYVPGQVVGDVKNVKRLSYSPQMKDNVAICLAGAPTRVFDVRWYGETALLPSTPRFDLVVRSPNHRHKATTVYRPLLDAVHDNGGEVYDLIDDEVEGRDED